MAVAEFIVMFREAFEIALVLGIMLAYLKKTGNEKYARHVWAGALIAVAASLLAAAAFEGVAGGFEQNEALFEGIALVLSSLLVSWLLIWMFGQHHFARQIERGLEVKIERRQAAGMVAFSFLAVFREGVEIVIFLWSISLASGAVDAAGAAAGAVCAALLGFAVFSQLVKLDLGLFFRATSALLVLLAAGLLSQGVHELQEAGAIPTSIERIYDFTPQKNADGSYPLLHEKGAAGSLLKGLVGYDTAPSLEQAAAYVAYLAAMLYAYRRSFTQGQRTLY